MSYKSYNKSQQQGAVLLIFALILLIGSTYSLIKKLNTETNYYLRQSKETQQSLRLAKQALIGYAVTYPDVVNSDFGPGYLPCPDRDNDGDTDAGQCSSAGNTTIGRFPFETLEMAELRDGSGARLWYALSDNFRNNPKLEPLNSETEGQLSVDGNSDIVAVVIAPGAPIGNQNRNPADTNILTEIANYLETENNDLDLDFISIDPSTTDFTDFNDRVIAITRQELMAVIEKRVLGEAKLVLETYKSTHGAYPWLSPFADPKAVARKLTGTADAGGSSTLLNDSANNFTTRGVAIGDVVYNLTDGSIGAVSAVAANALGITGLALGTDNDFDVDDEYVVMPVATPTVLTGVATSTGDNDTLNDNSRNLNNIGIAVSDIVDNITDGSSAIIKSISTNSIEVDGLSGGTDNLFQLNDAYQIRSNYGVATNVAESATQIDDSSKDFVTMGVQAGELVQNITDGSFGRITVVSANSLTVEELKFGTNNTFSNGDNYVLPRFNTDSNSREGLLSLHETGEPFFTLFNLDWNVNTLNAGDIVFDTATFPNVEVNYRMASLYLQNYALSGSLTIDDADAFCIWAVPDIADCRASFLDYISISGNLTSGSDTVVITDSAAKFITNNVKRGDIAQNFDDESAVISGIADSGSTGTTLIDAGVDFSVYEPYNYAIQNNTLETELGVSKVQGLISKVSDANTLTAISYVGEASTPIEFRENDSYTIYRPVKVVVESVFSETQLSTDNYNSGTNPDFDNGEYYRIVPAGNSLSGQVDFYFNIGAPYYDLLFDSDADYINEGVEVGDIVEDITDGSFGEINYVAATFITANLYGGASNSFTNGGNYTVYHDYVYSRKHEFMTRYSGNQATNTVLQERVRDVCVGYTADCSTVSTAVNFSGNGGVPFITIRDYEVDGVTEVGRATFTPSSSSTGSLRTSNIDYYLNTITDAIPDWFINNDWHKLIYVAFSAGNAPGGAGVCTEGTNCITLTGAGNPDNKNAIVIAAGMEINTTLDSSCATITSTLQKRINGTINEYYESENCSAGDDNFQKQFTINTFNDQVRVVEPSP